MNVSKSSKLEKVTFFLSFLPILVTLIALPALPNLIPAHYGISGEVNRWGNKYESLILPIFSILWAFFPTLIRKLSVGSDANGGTGNQKMLDILFLVPVLVFNILCFVSLSMDFSRATSFSSFGFNRVIVIVLALGDITFGNYLPKWRHNSRNSSLVSTTRKGEKNRVETDRLAGKLFVLTGIAVIAVCAFLPESSLLIIIYAVSAILDLTIILVCSQHAARGAEKGIKK